MKTITLTDDEYDTTIKTLEQEHFAYITNLLEKNTKSWETNPKTIFLRTGDIIQSGDFIGTSHSVMGVCVTSRKGIVIYQVVCGKRCSVSTMDVWIYEAVDVD